MYQQALSIIAKLLLKTMTLQNPKNIFPDKFGSSKSRKEYMREYMKKKRMNNEFRAKENQRKKMYNRTYKNSNPEKVKESQKRANAAYKQSKSQKVKQTQKKSKCSLQTIHF